MVTPPGLYQTPAKPRPDWLTRNWKWVVPVGLVGGLLIVGGFVGGIFLIVESSFRQSGCYTQALVKARANAEVQEKIGQPLTPGWLAGGSINISGSSGDADISIPISGPKGKGTLYVVAKKSAGEWTFQRLEVEIEGAERRIDLLKTAETGPEK
ncbi:MAG TPA: cytochrome c oxidase assembly factor Coa1 family protein [Candidatus Dormibacteraeota bacterium]|nr:cytochrome c oxidase assembly factor Coa1 family protein [Candidatus Dormibacteraeota bacterium]